MRLYCIKDIYKTEYDVQPAHLQIFNSIMNSPWALKFFFGLIIDSKVVEKRKKYIISFGLIMTIFQIFIFLKLSNSAISTCIVMFLYNIGASFIDATIDSMIVQQARKDPVSGQQDLYCFGFLFFGAGAAIGSIVSAVVT